MNNMKWMLAKVLIVSGALLVSGALAMAQQQPPGDAMPQQQQPNSNVNSPPIGQQGVLEVQEHEPVMRQMEDREFVHNAMKCSMAEVRLGQLAEQKAASPDVKQLAQRIAQDHAQFLSEMKPIAQQLGVKPPKAISKNNEKLDAKLQGLSGSQFDDVYLKALVKNHTSDLSNFRHEAATTQDPKLRQAAERGEQMVEAHLKLIRQVAKIHGVKG